MPFEVIVVVSGSDDTAEVVRSRFPGVTVIRLPGRALPGEARNAGLRIASGDLVVFPSSNIELSPGALQARFDAHERGWAMVTGPVLNGNRSRAGWASYFLDHSALLPGRPSGEMDTAPTRCSYIRFLLDQVGGFPEGVRAGEDTAVNLELWGRGFSAFREERAAATHTTLISDTATLVRRHFERGEAWAAILLTRYRSRPAVLLGRLPYLLTYLPARLLRLHRNVRAWAGSDRSEYRRSYPLIVAGATAAWAGLIAGLVAGPRARLTPPFSDLHDPSGNVGLDDAYSRRNVVQVDEGQPDPC